MFPATTLEARNVVIAGTPEGAHRLGPCSASGIRHERTTVSEMRRRNNCMRAECGNVKHWYLIRNGGVVDTQIGDTRRLFHLYISYYAYRTTRLRLLGNAESPPVLLSPRSPDLVTLSKASADLSRSCLRDPRRLSDSLSRPERSRS